MLNEITRAFIEGRGSLASVERAVDESENPLVTRAELEKELAAEWAFKNLFSTIPAPVKGLAGVMAALRRAPAPELSSLQVEALPEIHAELRGHAQRIPEPVGGFAAAIGRMKSKLAATPDPVRNAVMDIQPSLDTPDAGTKTTRKTRRLTRKILRMPRGARNRDVLAAGKDLPENPNDLPNA